MAHHPRSRAGWVSMVHQKRSECPSTFLIIKGQPLVSKTGHMKLVSATDDAQ